MKVVVTGGCGFIGSHLVDRLIKENHKVIVIDNLSSGQKENLNPVAKFYKLDILDSKVSEVFRKEKPEIIFHLAAQIDVRKSVEKPIEDANTNILGSLNILENCKRYKIKKIIFISTGGAIYGEADIVPTPENYPEFPLSPYGICKLTIEKYLNYYYKVFRLPFISLRLANVYGPRQNSKGEAGVVAIFCDKMLLKKQAIINGDGNQTRDFVFVEDAVEANISAMKSDRIDVYNIGTGQEVDINTIFRTLNKMIGNNCKKIHIPSRSCEQRRSSLDSNKAKKELGWEPKMGLDTGLKITKDWFARHLINNETS